MEHDAPAGTDPQDKMSPASLKGRSGLNRMISAFSNSLQGLQAAWRHECAFREELLLAVVMSAVALFLPVTALERALLIGVWIIVLIVELLNSAIEAVVDLVSPDWHVLAKRAKDAASAAVLLSLVLAALVWISILLALWEK